MNHDLRKMTMLPILLACVYCNPARGQAPAANLYNELQNVVEYQVHTSDLSKYRMDPSVTQGKIAKGLDVDGFQVNLRVPPDGGTGTTTVQISSAWIPGAPVSIG